MLITIIDLETTGLDPNTHEIAEIAGVLVSVPHRAILQQASTLLPIDSNPAIGINGIDPAVSQFLQERSKDMGWELIGEMMSASDYLVAFNSDFERRWLPGWDDWSDAAAFRYPNLGTSRSLVNLCVANGVPVVRAHRALDDALLAWDLMRQLPNLEAEIVRASQPKILVRALISFADKDLAKDRGFRWDDLVPRAWAKKILPDELDDLPFRVEVMT